MSDLIWSAPTLLLALDTTPIRNRWIILTVSVLYKKRAIPVAWRVLARDKQAWNPIWKQLLSALAPAFPPGVRVLVFADRGLYSPELFVYLQQFGVHPMIRVNGDCGVLVERRVVSVFRRGWLLMWLEILACVDGLCRGWFPDPLEPVEDGGSRA